MVIAYYSSHNQTKGDIMITTKTKTRTKTLVGVKEEATIDTLSKVSIVTMGVISGAIGLWATSCFIGMIANEGLVQTVKGFFAATFGG